MWMPFSRSNAVFMASSTLLVASVQMSMSSSRRSPAEITPRSKFFSTFCAFASYSSRIVFFSAGMATSSTEIVTPDRVAQ